MILIAFEAREICAQEFNVIQAAVDFDANISNRGDQFCRIA